MIMSFWMSMANGSLYEACRLKANRWDEGGATSNLLGYGSLHEGFQERTEQRWDETMGQAAIRCPDRKPPGSRRELRLTQAAHLLAYNFLMTTGASPKRMIDVRIAVRDNQLCVGVSEPLKDT
jgi:hypothetical protein